MVAKLETDLVAHRRDLYTPHCTASKIRLVMGILPIKRLDCSANGGPRVIGDDGIFSPKHGTVTDNSFRSVLSPNHAAQFSNTTESRMLTTGNLRSSNTIF